MAGLAPIHERLGVFRQSLFDKPGENVAREDVSSQNDRSRSIESKTPDLSPPQPAAAPKEVTGAAEPSGPSDIADGSQAPSRGSEPKSAPPKGTVFSAESAALSVEKSGPRTIVVGKEGVYEVVVRNHSPVAADRVVVSVDLPPWTDVAGRDATAKPAPELDCGPAGVGLGLVREKVG